MIQVTVQVRAPIPVADGGGFPDGTFTELLQREVHQPGLDPAWCQILTDIRIIDGGDTAELTLHCEPRQSHHQAELALRVYPGTPPAYVKLIDADGTVLHAGKHPSPFPNGQRVAIGEHLYEVTGHEWPGRHPETGVCAGDIDWQIASVRKVDEPSLFPSAV